jgi:hypothetical protein
MIYDITRPFFYQFLSDYSWNLFEEKMRMRGKGSGTFFGYYDDTYSKD